MFHRILARAIGWWCCLLVAISGASAVDLPAPPWVEGVTGTSATVRWYTEVPTGTRVHYGVEPNRLTKLVEGGVGTMHEVTLQGLRPGTTYFFSVGTARKLLATGNFATLSSPGSGTAPASSSPLAKVRGLLGRLFGEAETAVPPAPAPVAERLPPAAVTWGDLASLPDHFDRHGADFGARSAEDYAAHAWRFRQRARAGGLLVKVDDDGVQRVFDPATGAFAAYNPGGTTKTYFKPGSRDYFNRQPGRLVRAATP